MIDPIAAAAAIAGMAIVTYVPRLLPLVMLRRLRLPRFMKRQLQLMPYAALGALIFPGVLESTASLSSALAGAAAAAALALLRANLLIIVVGSIAAVYLTELWL